MGMQRTLWHHDAETHARPVNAAVYWVCRKDAHCAAPSRGGRGGLSVHQGRWAYCDGAVDDDRHEWAPTGGVPIDSLVDWAKALNALRGKAVRR